jgi:hypothetical protein
MLLLFGRHMRCLQGFLQGIGLAKKLYAHLPALARMIALLRKLGWRALSIEKEPQQ